MSTPIVAIQNGFRYGPVDVYRADSDEITGNVTIGLHTQKMTLGDIQIRVAADGGVWIFYNGENVAHVVA